ncbi:MAG: vWA domain-containing protein [Promethearchaeota archaeon]
MKSKTIYVLFFLSSMLVVVFNIGVIGNSIEPVISESDDELTIEPVTSNPGVIYTETLDIYTYSVGGTINWSHTYDGSANPIETATLTIVADDVDGPSNITDGEQDEVYFNGHYLGLLNDIGYYTNWNYDPGPGNPNQPLTTTTFNLDPAWISPTMPIVVDVETLWGVEIETSTLTVHQEQHLFDKTLSKYEGNLGDVVHVELMVKVPSCEIVTVVDTLPSGFHYIDGSFVVDGVSANPIVKNHDITYTITSCGIHVIEFDVKVDEAKTWENMIVYNIATATWYLDGDITDEKEDTECFIIHPFEEFSKNVGIPKADVIFAIDLTGSMIDEIAVVKNQSTNIMNTLASQIADVQFGLISFMDYDGWYTTTEPGSSPETYYAHYGDAAYGDYPYKLDQDITSDTTLMATKIAGLTNGAGFDLPEDYTRIIHETWNDTNLSWRDNSTRIVILFGDDVPHDSNFDNDNDSISENTGGDPGRDTILGTADDLNFETEVANAKANDIHIMAVYSGENSTKYPWEYVATETSGDYFYLSEAEQIPDAIKELIESQIEESLTIKEKTETQWALVFEVTNTFSYTMTEAIIQDRFGAEIEIDEPFPVSITHGTVTYKTKGKSQKVFLTWEIGDLDPDETARLIILVSTDLNPAGKQEYTSPGIYELNSGATLKFIDPEQDIQLSASTDSINVTVLPEEDP